MVSDMNKAKCFYPTSSFICEAYIENEQHYLSQRWGDNIAFWDSTVEHMWPYEDHIHGRCKVFFYFHWRFLDESIGVHVDVKKMFGKGQEARARAQALVKMQSKYKIKVHQIGWLVLETLIVDGNAKCQLSS